MKQQNTGRKQERVYQPPSGGCVLKLERSYSYWYFPYQPPSGGCVLKHTDGVRLGFRLFQPPSGGCVLKHDVFCAGCNAGQPAAFGRLCVETSWLSSERFRRAPAAFGRLCVETLVSTHSSLNGITQPPSGGCVLKPSAFAMPMPMRASRLRAAVC